MMELVGDILSWGCILIGLAFVLIGTIGVLRMPDVFTRLHAAGMTDTMGAGFVLLGLAFQGGFTLVTVRLALIWIFLMFTSPISTHALARAALHGKVEPIRVHIAGGGP
jgi:multicomponent Na+:H+ antiporter subunit G